MNQPENKSILCPNCRRLISVDENRCPHCGIATPGARWKNNPLTRGWGSGDQLIRYIIIANIGLYLLSLLISSMMPPGFTLTPSRKVLEYLGATGTQAMHNGGWWTIVAANYLHAGVLHIFFNMMAFNQIAVLTTRLFGPYRFFAIYTLSGVGGFIASYIAGVYITVGASAALCGLIGAALYYGKNRGGIFGQAIYKQIGVWALGILLLGFLIPQVNNFAHIGGMAAGALTAMLFGYTEKRRENLLHRTIAGACLAITVMVMLFVVFRGVRVWLS